MARVGIARSQRAGWFRQSRERTERKQRSRTRGCSSEGSSCWSRGAAIADGRENPGEGEWRVTRGGTSGKQREVEREEGAEKRGL